MIEGVLDGKKCIARMDSECSRSIETRSVCNPLSRQTSGILTVNSKILHCDGVGTITLVVGNLSPAKADVLVVDRPLLGFDMLIEMDIIMMLSGVNINQSGDATFSRTELCACAAIRIEEPDVSVKLDKQTKVWTAS